MMRRLGWQALRFAALMVVVSVVTFALVAASPIDPVSTNTGQAAYARMSEEKREQLRAYWGAETPMWERYAAWGERALQGDLGDSLRFNRPVVEVIAERAGNTALLMVSAWVLSGIFGMALGLVAGMRRGRMADRAIRAWCFVMSATPAFWLGLLLLMVFSVALGWFPFGFSAPIGLDGAAVSWGERLHHLVLPAATLSLVSVSGVALHTREKVIDVMESDYVRFARSRGERTGRIVRSHVLRNVALPAITLQCAQVGEIFGGSVLVEQVFSYPGLGQAAVVAGTGGDAPLLVGIALASAAIVCAGNAVANVLYGVVDPRMRRARGWSHAS